MDSEGKTLDFSAGKSSQLMQCLQVVRIPVWELSDREWDIVGDYWINLGQEVKKGNWRVCNRVDFDCNCCVLEEGCETVARRGQEHWHPSIA